MADYNNSTISEVLELRRDEPYLFQLLWDAVLIQGEAEPRAMKLQDEKDKQKKAREKMASPQRGSLR